MKSLLDIFYPRSCCGCWKTWSYLCFECKQSFCPHPEICPSCHRPTRDFKTCPDCVLAGKCFLDGLLIGFSYQKFLKKLILKLKFQHKKDIVYFFAERAALLVQMNTYLQKALEQKKLVLSFVPAHRYRKYFQKGYNQSELLAYALGDLLQLPVFPLFEKPRKTTSQVSLSREERFKNLKNAFVCKQETQLSPDMTVLLIDDVTTTWATLNELAKTLKQVRADVTIWGMVLARNTN